MIKKVLVANRGEIALRIIRSAKEMNIATVAVYSEADRESLPVKMSDEAVFIGNSPANESYLVASKIIEVAKKTGADAIHPGYGFLSENADFARLCINEGINFIGPSPDAMATMGDKITARKKMIAAGVNVVPGIEISDFESDALLQEALKIGYPLMVKASAGGGGKGMRLVRQASELIDAVNIAKSEAKSAFGDDTVYIEKYIESPHHIEFQILADKFGNTIHINERECSIQRRHQKVIEETPSPLMTPELRRIMGEQAVRAAKAVEYFGAGTIEFLVDNQHNFYFLEMNTRLQVEHPITETTSGLDLVKEQIRVAAGERLELQQEQVKQFGHSIECRVYAEDPDNNFLPNPGRVSFINRPGGTGVRVDGYVYSGFTVPLYYDPMIAKVIVWGKDRNEAILRMKRALEESRILGVKHNIPFLHKIINNPYFIQGDYDTHFIEKHFDTLSEPSPSMQERCDISSIVVYLDYINALNKKATNSSIAQSKWSFQGRINTLR